MRLSLPIAVLICACCCGPAFAQQGVFYPEVSGLRTALLQLLAEQPQAFQRIKGAALYKKTTVQYYRATLHLVPADTPKIAEDTQPLQAYYLDFLAKGLTVAQSKAAFEKWQSLIQAALPDFTMQLAGNQYPDLESRDFISPAGTPKLTLYRNGSGTECQVSVGIINNNLNQLAAVVADKPQPAAARPEEGPALTPISREEFIPKLKQLLAYAKTGFTAIKGAEIPGRTFPSNRTDFRLPGATEVSIMNVGIGTDYEAYYARNAGKAQAEALFGQLRDLLKAGLPADFAGQAPVQRGPDKSIAFVEAATKLRVEIRMSKYFSGEEYNLRLYVSQQRF